MYEFKLQKRNGGHRVVLVETANNKLVLAGETIKRLIDATTVVNKLRDGYNDKRSTMPVIPVEVLPLNYKFSKNSGPKKKAPKKTMDISTALAMALKKVAAERAKIEPYSKAKFGKSFADIKKPVKLTKKAKG